ncbi:MAG: alpha-L-rhamnosidase N-terminal domain-containing protein [Thermoprotei archaeon]|nr:alpha-L-rhamnosidase N-terminal domain-containing protein [Thermoprotei archaeon]
MAGDWIAKWIWIKGEERPYNYYLYFRKSFDIPDSVEKGLLRITADTSYVLYINGRRIGEGPARSWPFRKSYDVYDVTGYLRSGRNVIAVLVHHAGISTFKYVEGRGGLLCQLNITLANGDSLVVGTDDTWKVKEAVAYIRRVPRVSCQQGWVEAYDARLEPLGWNDVGFDDSEWERAVIVGPVGTEPWTEMEEREIPLPTREPKLPVNLEWAKAVRPPPYTICLDLRPILLPGKLDANPAGFTAVLATIVKADKPTKAKLLFTHGPWFTVTPKPEGIRVNGKRARVEDNYVVLDLREGENLVLMDITGEYHDWVFSAILLSDDQLSFRAPLLKGFRYAVFGPFDSKEDLHFQAILKAGKEEDLREYEGYIKGIPERYEYLDVFALTAYREELSSEVKVENTHAICSSSGEPVIVYPSPEGDVELLIDFGKEVYGFIDFEVEAEEGVILDWNFFEAMPEGRIQYTKGLNNVLRHITRKGLQRYLSIVKRGFRYATLTFRNFKKPVKIRGISCLISTHPVMARGRFSCSDYLLNEAWRVGAYTVRLCMDDTFMDCPAYEQTFWVGDARNEALVAYVAFGDYKLARRCWKLAADSLHRSPLPESQVPSGWRNILTTWSLLWILACEEYYMYTGDVRFLEEIYPAVAKTCRNLEGYLNEKGLLEITAWNMLDWAPMDTPSSGIVTHLNAWLVEALRRAANMALALGYKDDAQHFLKLSKKVKEAINEHLWDEGAQAYIDSIHADGTRSKVISVQTNAVVYLCDCVTPEREQVIRKKILDPPEDWVRPGSPFVLFFILEALEKMGEHKRIIDYIRRYWGFMLDRGATTFWETFPGWMKDIWTRSYCHGWSSAPTYFLSTLILGVRPAKPGFRRARIEPKICDLRRARGRVPTPLGDIYVAWERNDEGKFKLSIRLPKDVEGEVVWPIPADEHPNLMVRGKGLLSKDLKDGLWFLQLDKGAEIVAESRP